jgi:prepilin-type N-terminal cleavage/methylation domain-containing protein
MDRESGLSMIEVMAVVAIMGLGLGIASLMLQPLETPLESGATLLEGLFRQARLEAIATTAAYRISPENSWVLGSAYAPSCAAAEEDWTPDSTVELQLPEGVSVSETDWSVCFTSRGIATTNHTIQLQHDQYGTIDIEVLLGGTTRVID